MTTIIRDATREILARPVTPPVVGSPARPRPPFTPDAFIKAMQLCRFPLALAVVMVHSGYFVLIQVAGPAPGGEGVGAWLVRFAIFLSMPATSGFLIFAGFLFFRDGPVSMADYRRKLRARVYTILVPYLAWNLIAVLVLCGPTAGKYVFQGHKFMAASPVSWHSLMAWFAGWPIFPADAPLWFLRDMLILSMVTPVLAWIPGWARVLGLAGVLLYWFWGPIDLIPGGIPRAFSAFFFGVGACMGMSRTMLKPGRGTDSLMAGSALVVVLAAAWGAGLGPLTGNESAGQMLAEKIVRFAGTFTVVCAATRVMRAGPISRLLYLLSRASFFVYACHFCVLISLGMLLRHLPPDRLGIGHGPLLLGLVCVVATSFSLGAYFLSKRYVPSVMLLLDGWRSARNYGKPPAGQPREVPARQRVGFPSAGAV